MLNDTYMKTFMTNIYAKTSSNSNHSLSVTDAECTECTNRVQSCSFNLIPPRQMVANFPFDNYKLALKINRQKTRQTRIVPSHSNTLPQPKEPDPLLHQQINSNHRSAQAYSIQANISALAPRPDGWHLTFLCSRDEGGRNEPAYAPWHGALCRKIKTWLSLTASLRAEPIHHPGYRGDWSKVSSISSLCYFLSQSPHEAWKRRANTIICTETVRTTSHSRLFYTSYWLSYMNKNRVSMQTNAALNRLQVIWSNSRSTYEFELKCYRTEQNFT